MPKVLYEDENIVVYMSRYYLHEVLEDEESAELIAQEARDRECLWLNVYSQGGLTQAMHFVKHSAALISKLARYVHEVMHGDV